MKTIDYAEKLLQLVEEGTSPFHVTASVARQLEKAGFEKLLMGEGWNLKKGGRYFMEVYGSSLIAFTVGKNYVPGEALRLAASHTDFPGLRIKGKPEIEREGYRQLNVEVYGGAILNTWLDRPLSAAGRVVCRSADLFSPAVHYVDFQKPFLLIPNLAIHMNREVNKGIELNRQQDMLPIVGLSGKEANTSFFMEYLAEKLKVEKEDILEFELGLYNTDTGDFLGMSEEFISSPRLDNLTSVQAVISAVIEGERESGINVACCFDNEEIGNRTKQGAWSMVLPHVLERISLSFGGDRELMLRSFADSMLLSVDVGHAIHPNHPERADITCKDVLGKGFCIKEASVQSYATDSQAIGILQQICDQEKIPYQKFFNRSDSAGGGTLGGAVSSLLPVKTVDIGVPLLAMHSCRELMGTADQESLTRAVAAFYSL